MPDRLQLMEASLERAAETVGDITAPVLARYYGAFPEALASFEHHGLGNREALEAQMVENALYCIMNWLDRPGEVGLILGESVPHHQETLSVALGWYRGLVEATIDVIVETIPPGETAELEVWRTIRSELADLVEASKSTYVPRSHAISA